MFSGTDYACLPATGYWEEIAGIPWRKGAAMDISALNSSACAGYFPTAIGDREKNACAATHGWDTTSRPEKRDEAAGDTAAAVQFPTRERGVNLLGFLLESLFLESVDDERNTAPEGVSPEAGQPEQTVFRQSARGEDLKQLLDDVTTGRTSLADLPQAMAGISSNAAGGRVKKNVIGKKDGGGLNAAV